MAKNVITVSYAPAMLIAGLLLPAWVRNPTTMPHTGDRNKITIQVTRRFPEERWLIVPRSTDKSVLLASVLMAQGPKLVQECDVRVVVLVPPINFASFYVRCLERQ